MILNLTIEVDDSEIAKHLADNPTKTVQDVRNELSNACVLGMDCINAIVLRQYEIELSDYFVNK